MAEQLVQKHEMLEYEKLLINGVMPYVTDVITLKSGSSYVKGTVLGIETSSGHAAIVNSSLSDGTEAAYGILAEDVDATGENQVAVVYLTGEFNEDALVFGGSDKVTNHKAALRKLGIFVKKVI